MWGLLRRLLSLKALFGLLAGYVVVSASAIAFLNLTGAAVLLAFVTMGFSVVAIGVLGAYVKWIRKEVASMNSPPPGWDWNRDGDRDQQADMGEE